MRSAAAAALVQASKARKKVPIVNACFTSESLNKGERRGKGSVVIAILYSAITAAVSSVKSGRA